MPITRSSGVLLHPTSLPGRYGIGGLGEAAHAFVGRLADCGQTWWQMLPVGPTGYGNSPYQSYSSHAGNPLLLSIQRLRSVGMLATADLRDYPACNDDHVDFDLVAAAKSAALARAYAEFHRTHDRDEYTTFIHENASWLDDYALFMALKRENHGAAWRDWPAPLALREPAALAAARGRLADHIDYTRFEQYVFAQQWQALRATCAVRGVKLIGDLPIYVAADSADVWSRPELFELDERGLPRFEAGVPPDYFNADGQLWGNPIYHWEAHRAENFAWWAERLRSTLRRFDLVRLDHFRGFDRYWAVPAGSATARPGHWYDAPGRELLTAVRAALGDLPLIAEDLGDIDAPVRALRDDFNLPGMRVLQFGFVGDEGSEYHLPHRHVQNAVAYTGTHDNDTTVGWFTGDLDHLETTQDPTQVLRERRRALRYVATPPVDFHWGLIRAALSSVAEIAIVPLQDLLGLDGSARMNVPGKVLPRNWSWRYRAPAFDNAVCDRLGQLTALFGRWNPHTPVPAHCQPDRAL